MTEHDHRGIAASLRPLLIAMTITASFTVIELVGGYLSGSLALMSDAGHMFTDTLALALSYGAMRVAMRLPTEERTFGMMRAEILAALVNGATLIIISVFIFYEAWQRFVGPPRIDAELMLAVAALGLLANAAGILLLRDRSRRSLNTRAAFLHMVGDFLSSVGVIVGAVLIWLFDFRIADPIISVLIGVIIIYGAWKLVTQSTSILLESVPPHLTLKDVRDGLMSIDGVTGVHDLHVWTLSSGLHSLSAHLQVGDMRVSDCSSLIERCEEMLRKNFSITHTTFQLECENCDSKCVFRSPEDHQ